MIRQGVLAAVVTLPPSAHSSSRTLTDLWVISRRHKRGEDVLFSDASTVDPASEGSYRAVTHTVANWLDGVRDVDDSRFVRVNPMELLGPTVILDPQYWCARAATPTASSELIAEVEKTADLVRRALEAAAAKSLPPIPLLPATPPSITVREARDDGLLSVVPRPTRPSSDSRKLSASRAELEGNVISIRAAEAMRTEQYSALKTVQDPAPQAETADDDLVAESVSKSTVRAGDVLVWATSDHEVRAVVCPVSGGTASSVVTVLRCGAELNAGYLALVLSAGRNAIHTTGSTTAMIRALDLQLPLVPLAKQQQIAEYVATAGSLSALAQSISAVADIYVGQLADALGSGAVTIDEAADD
jgi:hypothetical protein